MIIAFLSANFWLNALDLPSTSCTYHVLFWQRRFVINYCQSCPQKQFNVFNLYTAVTTGHQSKMAAEQTVLLVLSSCIQTPKCFMNSLGYEPCIKAEARWRMTNAMSSCICEILLEMHAKLDLGLSISGLVSEISCPIPVFFGFVSCFLLSRRTSTNSTQFFCNTFMGLNLNNSSLFSDLHPTSQHSPRFYSGV